MKSIVLTAAIFSMAISCTNNKEKTSSQVETSKAAPDTTSMNMPATPATADISGIVTHYLHIKNALVSNNSSEAATAAKEFISVASSIDKTKLTTEGQKMFGDVSASLNEHATHISTNGSNIKHQREHFQELSEDVYDLVKVVGSNTTLYKDYCPMLKANWISETKDINNPYYGNGSDMATCGELKETLPNKP